jgi:putative FmdB family regulatory protein
MPIYEYECGACGERREFIQKFSDAPKRKCPACGASRLKRLVSAAAFHLKGTGWYVTDFRDKNKKKDGDKEATSSGKDSAKSSSKDSDTSSKETTTTKTAEKTTKSSDSTTKSGDKKSAG